MVELKQPNPSILTHLFSPANLSGHPRSRCVPARRALELQAHFESEEYEGWLINNVIIIIPITTLPQFMYSMCCLLAYFGKQQESRIGVKK